MRPRSVAVLLILLVSGLMGMLLMGCGGQATPAPTSVPATAVPPTAIPPTAVPPTAVPPTAVPPTAVPPTAAPEAAAPFTATIKIKAVAPAEGIKITVAGTEETVDLATSGLRNVPVGVPQYLVGGAIMPKDSSLKGYAWTLTSPEGSVAEFDDASSATPVFTPDQVGQYKIQLVVTDAEGKQSAPAELTINAATYVGVGGIGGAAAKPPQCSACHADKASEWKETGHASFFKEGIDGEVSKHYGPSCITCHTVGYYPGEGADNGGFDDVAKAVGWEFPKELKEGNWDAVPDELKELSNIQCENCHGPGSAHMGDKTKIDVSLDIGVCAQCHDAPSHHLKPLQLRKSGHGDASAMAFNYPTGPKHQACVRCHSGAGFVDYAEGKPQDQWRNYKMPIYCAVCHDPHSAENPFQLRNFDTTVAPLPDGTEVKGKGLSAICMNCHNGRVKPEDYAKSRPHYSAAAEAILGVGGIDYGQTIKNSPHGMVVGASAVEGKYDGQVPGPCVTCHMADTPGLDENKKPLPGNNEVGEHTFNMVSPDGKVEHVEVCQSCHSGITTFDFPAEADYDGNGKVEGVQTEVKGLIDVLTKALADSGIARQDRYPYWKGLDKATDAQLKAIYNIQFVWGPPPHDGRAAAIHNFDRTVMLLQLSYKNLTGKDVPNATLLK